MENLDLCIDEMKPFMVASAPFKGTPGLSDLDAFRKTPRTGYHKYYESVSDSKSASFLRSTDFFLDTGIALGLDDQRMAWPFIPGHGLKFIGFNVGLSEIGVQVKVRGSVVLRLTGANAVSHKAAPVYVLGPNSFSLEKTEGAVEIGAVRYVQDNGLVAVAFRAFDDSRPLRLNP
jgi:hypothetical protein